MSTSPQLTTSHNILIVEGPNDKHVIKALLPHRDFTLLLPEEYAGEDAQQKSATGIDALLRALPRRLKQEDVKTLGIVVDADLNVENRWKSVCTRLTQVGYTKLPKSPPVEGYILESPDPFLPRFGAWLMPNNQDIGTTEDFIRLLIPATDELSSQADRILNELEALKIQQYPKKDRGKAFINTWLAWQKDPELRIGQAITAKVLEKDAPIAASFTDWLRKLFLTTG
jgi:hypothetical protein